MRQGKVQYIEGLRGLAAMQVVAMHFVSAFLPEAERSAWPPIKILFDGHTAVYLFFLISGAVLTSSLSRTGPAIPKIVKRLVRLGLPAAAAACIALLLLALMPNAHREAAALSGSAWLATDSSGAPTLTHLFRETTLDSVLFGYRESTLFTRLSPDLPLIEDSLDAPFWSLHLEFYGSLLVLLLVTARARSMSLYAATVGASALAFGTHPMFLFVTGHLAAPLLSRRPSRRAAWLGVVLLAMGLALCGTKDFPLVERLRTALAKSELASAPNLFQFQSQLGAAALYFGVLLCAPLRPVLENRLCRALGRLSFSIYLLHFPILFTLACVMFVGLSRLAPGPAVVLTTGAAFLVCVVLAAEVFERWIDRPAVALSRGVGGGRLDGR